MVFAGLSFVRCYSIDILNWPAASTVTIDILFKNFHSCFFCLLLYVFEQSIDDGLQYRPTNANRWWITHQYSNDRSFFLFLKNKIYYMRAKKPTTAEQETPNQRANKPETTEKRIVQGGTNDTAFNAKVPLLILLVTKLMGTGKTIIA